MQKPSKWLTKGGLTRDDSDDELGYDDHPWQWIYNDAPEDNQDRATPRKRKATVLAASSRVPIGARMGSFQVKVGDAVLLKSPEQGKDWAGLICAFSETDDDGEEEMCANIQWFCSPSELIGGKRSKARPDILPNESYITTDFNLNPLTAINGRATVMSPAAFFKKYPKGAPPRSMTAAIKYNKTVLCRRGVKQRNLQYTDEFVWEDIYQGAESLLDLYEWIKAQTKMKKKFVKDGSMATDQEYILRHDEHTIEPVTPRKRRKTTSATSTPRSSTKIAKYATPTHQRIIIKRPLEITPLGTRLLSPSAFLSSPYAHARTTLHVSAVPDALPCRSHEFSTVYQHLHSAITEGSGSCIYISGTPGTGKTATVREVVAQLHNAVLADELDDFDFVEINGMKVTEPQQSYSLLWEALKGDRVSPSHALSLLEHEFSHPSPRRIPCVVLMDELDQLVTKSQSVMYNFFNWPVLRHSRLIVLAVANTMDLPERTLSNKISSRLGLTRITFPGYTHTQLMEIITSRLEGVPGNIVDPDAVQFASRKVAAVSGDARRALDICRRAVEIAEQAQAQAVQNDQQADEAVEQSTPSRKNKASHKSTESTPRNQSRVTIATIKQAINEATSSPVSQHLHSSSLALSAKLFLAALCARARRTGVAEATLGDVLTEAKRLAAVANYGGVKNFLLLDHHDWSRGEKEETPRVLAMGAAAMELVEAGIIAVETRARHERSGKIRLRIDEEEIKAALAGDEQVKGLGWD